MRESGLIGWRADPGVHAAIDGPCVAGRRQFCASMQAGSSSGRLAES